jgi:hypothetical protein
MGDLPERRSYHSQAIHENKYVNQVFVLFLKTIIIVFTFMEGKILRKKFMGTSGDSIWRRHMLLVKTTIQNANGNA